MSKTVTTNIRTREDVSNDINIIYQTMNNPQPYYSQETHNQLIATLDMLHKELGTKQ